MSEVSIEEDRAPGPIPESYTLDGVKEARRQWDFVIGRSNRTLMVWRLIAIAALLLSAVCLWYAFDNMSQPKMVPYVVTVDASTGRVDFRGVIQPRALEVSDAVVRHHLLRFIENTRTVSSDQAITRRFLQEAYYIATPAAGRQLTEMISGRENNPLQMSANGFRRDIQVELFEKLGERLWRVEWMEEVRQNGELVDRISRTGSFSFVTATPADELEAEQNPFGFYVDEFHLAARR